MAMDFLYGPALWSRMCVCILFYDWRVKNAARLCVCVCAFELCKNILKLRRRRLQQNPPSTLYLQHCRLLISLFVLPPVSSLLSQFYLPFMYAHMCGAPLLPKKRKPPTNHFSSFGLATHSAEFSFLFLLFRYFFFFSILYYFMICFGLAHISIEIDIYGGKYF